MALSNKYGWLVVSTGNKSELAVGYSTLYGDMVGGFALLKDVFKTDVFRLAEHLNERAGRELIPRSTIERAPSAELRDDQRDADSIPPYDELDPVLEAYVEEDRSREELLARVRSRRRRASGRARRPRRVQAPPGAARREAAPEGVRPRPAHADHEPLEGLTRSDSNVRRHLRRPVDKELANKIRQAPRREVRVCCLELCQRPPPDGGHMLRVELRPRQPRNGIELSWRATK